MTPGNVSEVHDRAPKFVSFARQHKQWLMVAAAVFVVVLISINSAVARKNAHKDEPVASTDEKVQPTTPEQARAFLDKMQKDTADLKERMRQDKAKIEADKDKASGTLPSGGQVTHTGGTDGVATQRPVETSYTPRQSAPARSETADSNIAVSFRHGGQQAAAKASAPSDLQNLIEAQKAALQETLRAAVPVQRAPVQQAAQEQHEDATPEKHTDLQPAIGKEYKIFEGDVIETVLVNRLNGTFTGPVKVMVTNPVYSHDHQHVLIQRGSMVLGSAQKIGGTGQERLAVSFHRIIMPDGYSVDLDKFVGLNQVGETGLKDKVNHHYLEVFGTSIALGLIQGFSQFGTGSELNGNGTDRYRQGVASSIGQSSTQILGNRLNIMPTVVIREGHRVKVWIQSDLNLPAYENHRLPGDL